MAAQVKSKPVYKMDMSNPYRVESFHRDFAEFLQEHGRAQEAVDFYTKVKWYFKAFDEEEYSFRHLLAIAMQYADVLDTSGTLIVENPFLSDGGQHEFWLTPEEIHWVLDRVDRYISVNRRKKHQPRKRSQPKPNHPELIVHWALGDEDGYDLANAVFWKLANSGYDGEAQTFEDEVRYLESVRDRRVEKSGEQYATAMFNLDIGRLAKLYLTVKAHLPSERS